MEREKKTKKEKEEAEAEKRIDDSTRASLVLVVCIWFCRVYASLFAYVDVCVTVCVCFGVRVMQNPANDWQRRCLALTFDVACVLWAQYVLTSLIHSNAMCLRVWISRRYHFLHCSGINLLNPVRAHFLRTYRAVAILNVEFQYMPCVRGDGKGELWHKWHSIFFVGRRLYMFEMVGFIHFTLDLHAT